MHRPRSIQSQDGQRLQTQAYRKRCVATHGYAGWVKHCPRCGIDKPIGAFGPNRRRSDGLQSYCRVCRQEYVREHYARNVHKYRKSTVARNARRREAARRIIRQAKERPCADCGVQHPSYVMDFDHRAGVKKLFNIGRDGLRGGWSLESLKREIEKCDVICSNCHRIRTHGPAFELGRQDSNLD